jgi:hypothetical protein
MTTILVWLGSGFAFAIGVFCGAWLMKSVHKTPKDVLAGNEKATEALLERNKIGREQVEVLSAIAVTLEEILRAK